MLRLGRLTRGLTLRVGRAMLGARVPDRDVALGMRVGRALLPPTLRTARLPVTRVGVELLAPTPRITRLPVVRVGRAEDRLPTLDRDGTRRLVERLGTTRWGRASDPDRLFEVAERPLADVDSRVG
jgi:hypothetical protein